MNVLACENAIPVVYRYVALLGLAGAIAAAALGRRRIDRAFRTVRLVAGLAWARRFAGVRRPPVWKDSGVSIEGGIATVTYERCGKVEKLRVPYRRGMVAGMTTTDVYSVSNGVRTKITHQPGIPYLFTADDVGCDHLLVVDSGGNVLGRYGGTEPIPGHHFAESYLD